MGGQLQVPKTSSWSRPSLQDQKELKPFIKAAILHYQLCRQRSYSFIQTRIYAQLSAAREGRLILSRGPYAWVRMECKSPILSITPLRHKEVIYSVTGKINYHGDNILWYMTLSSQSSWGVVYISQVACLQWSWPWPIYSHLLRWC